MLTEHQMNEAFKSINHEGLYLLILSLVVARKCVVRMTNFLTVLKSLHE